MILIGPVPGDLGRKDQKSLTCYNVICCIVIQRKCTGSGYYIIEQIVVPGTGTKGFSGNIFCISGLIRGQIKKVLIGKYIL